MDERKKKELISQLIEIAHKLAKQIKMAHGGWWESYASIEEQELVRISDELKE